MNERVGRTGRWLRSGNSIVVLDDEVSGDGAELDELRLAGLVSSPPPLLRRGNRGPAVASLQRMLNTWVARSGRLLAPLKEDGIFGRLTEGRVISFQRENRLLVDGIVGGQTLGALKAGVGRLDPTIPASTGNEPEPPLVTDSPCLPQPPVTPVKLPMCFCVPRYATNQREVNDDQRPIVEAIALQIHRLRVFSGGPVLVIITGHTDFVGPKKYNIDLGRDRAQGVKETIQEFLTAREIPLPAIVTETKGRSRPIQHNNTAAGRAANRRVEVCVLASDVIF